MKVKAYQYILVTILISALLSIIIYMLVGRKGGAPPRESLAAVAPILTVGHGAFIAPDGRQILPDRQFILDAQKHYMASLRRQAAPGPEAGKLPADRARSLIHEQVKDEVLANALFIDWLLERVKPADAANLISINAALRWRYLVELQGKPLTSIEGLVKGLDPETAKKLEREGITVFLTTRRGGAAYIEECRAAGVPIPPPVFSPAWTNRGEVTDEFLSRDSKAELMHYASTSPQGVCLALPRYERTGDNTFSNQASLFGLICLGTQSSKACFWDNPRGKKFTKGVEVDISQFVGGVDLVPNGQGVCTDCHAGEDPYVVHPDKPPFAGLTPSLLPGGWHDPLVDASWPHNPGPTNVLDAVSSTARCDSCHRVGVAGRFPDASTALPGWCGVVLQLAVGAAPIATMPPAGFTKSQFTAHIDALKAACQAPPSTGVVVDVDLPDDKGFISSPIVIDPLYACATSVAVRGGIRGARIDVTVNGAVVNSRKCKGPFSEEFDVPALKVGDIVAAVQEFNGVLSAPSASITVRDHKADFPGGLPAPTIDPALIFECAEVISVRHVPGARLTVHTNGAFPSTRSTSSGWSAIFPGKRPFVVGDSFTAEIEMCSDKSPLSAAQTAVKEPASIPAPTFAPPVIYPRQELVTVQTLINGSRTTVEEIGTGPLGTFTTPVSWWPDFDVATPLGRPLDLGDQLRASQQLCSKGPPSEVPRTERCEQLPAPRISRPIAGNNYVVVIESVPGARIRVYDSGNNELGDGSGTVIVLRRPLTGADTVTVVQQLGDCTSKTGYRIDVRGQ